MPSPQKILSPAELDHGPLFSGGGWADFRVWSRRRPGSKSKETRISVELECTKRCKNRYHTERHKDFARRKADKQKLKPIQSEKEKRRLEKEEEKKKRNCEELLLLYKFCPMCHKQTLHKEVKKKYTPKS